MSEVLVFGLSSNLGGVETVFDTFYDYLDKKRYHFDFVARDGKIAFQEKYEKDGSKIFIVPNFMKRPIGYYLRIKKVLKKYRYDVVYINMLSAANILPVIAARNAGISTIVLHAHNNNTTGFIRKISHGLGKHFLQSNCYTRLACSDGAGRYIYGKSKYTIASNPFNYDRFKYNSSFRREIRKKYNIPNECKLLGVVGRLSYQKNPIFLIDVFKKISEKSSNVKLMFVGDGELKTAVIRKAKREGIIDRIIVVNNTREVYKYYSALDLFMMPSIYEGLGMVGLEAQASGLSCLFSNAVPKEIDMGGNKYLDLDIDMWEYNTIKMLSIPKDRKINRRTLFDSKFDVIKNTKLLAEAFEGGDYER